MKKSHLFICCILATLFFGADCNEDNTNGSNNDTGTDTTMNRNMARDYQPADTNRNFGDTTMNPQLEKRESDYDSIPK